MFPSTQKTMWPRDRAAGQYYFHRLYELQKKGAGIEWDQDVEHDRGPGIALAEDSLRGALMQVA